MGLNTFGARSTLLVGTRSFEIFRLDALSDRFDLEALPYSLRILLENLLRNEDDVAVTAADVEALADWDPDATHDREIAFSPARVLMQDFTGVPAIVDLAAMRDAMATMGGDPATIAPRVPVDLVIDHSISVDYYGVPDAFERNAEVEFRRNEERYRFLRWGQAAFDELRVVPPNTGICHQVNLEYLAHVVIANGEGQAYPDTLVGTDSHTTMVNGLGVLGWGVGGIEAEAAMLGQPMSMLMPKVVGFRLAGSLTEGATATDLVLTVTEMLRRRGVVGTFVEFYGPGVARIGLADRATIGNMAPEYGSTCAYFPIDEETLRYLAFTGRPPEVVDLVEAYAKEQALWHDPDGRVPNYSFTLELDLATVVPSIAGPSRPQDRIPLANAKATFASALRAALPAESSRSGDDNGDGPLLDQLPYGVLNGSPEDASRQSFPASDPPAAAEGVTGVGSPDGDPLSRRTSSSTERPRARVPVTVGDGSTFDLDHGHVVIAAITSCTNTSNPSVMIAAGLLAKRAVERGLTVPKWVKTSLAPGSKVVIDYYERAGLLPYLAALGFSLVGYGCTTCIGNSGPLRSEISAAIDSAGLAVAAVLSGNRNFEGRINPDVRMNYLASPPLVVAHALAGTMDIDLYNEPLGTSAHGDAVFLTDLWPSSEEVNDAIAGAVQSDMYRKSYGAVFTGDERWMALDIPSGERYAWAGDSTYIRRPPYFDAMPTAPDDVPDICDARVLAVLGDSVTTDHISPAGSIARTSSAAAWLASRGIDPANFNSYGSRRGNHEVMVRGTFANVRLRNRLAPGTEGGVTLHLPDAEPMPIYDAAMRYRADGVPLVVLAGKEYGAGSSRDWAAKGTALLGVRAVLAESFERIHRSNLIGMGVVPLQFLDGESVGTLGLDGHEVFTVEGLSRVPDEIDVRADGKTFRVRVRIDTPQEREYFRHGGILQYVLRRRLAAASPVR